MPEITDAHRHQADLIACLSSALRLAARLSPEAAPADRSAAFDQINQEIDAAAMALANARRVPAPRPQLVA